MREAFNAVTGPGPNTAVNGNPPGAASVALAAWRRGALTAAFVDVKCSKQACNGLATSYTAFKAEVTYLRCELLAQQKVSKLSVS